MAPSNKPLINFVIDPALLAALDDFRFGQRFESRAACIKWLLARGVASGSQPSRRHSRSAVADALAAVCEEQARYRDERAEQYPDDRKNANAAAALSFLAELARALPVDDPILVKLDSIERDSLSYLASSGNVTFPEGDDRTLDLDRFKFEQGDTPPTIAECRAELDRLADNLIASKEAWDEWRAAQS